MTFKTIYIYIYIYDLKRDGPSLEIRESSGRNLEIFKTSISQVLVSLDTRGGVVRHLRGF